MTIHDKFTTILKTNKLGIKSIFGLERFSKVGVGSVSKFLAKGESPTLGTIKTIHDALSINPEWWDTGKGEVYLGKHTDDNKPTGNNKMQNREEVYKTIVEGNTEYVLVPRAVMDNTRLVSADELDRKNDQIDFYQNQLGKLLEKLELQPKPSDSKKIKQ